jgi:hypothetical protein
MRFNLDVSALVDRGRFRTAMRTPPSKSHLTDSPGQFNQKVEIRRKSGR